MIRTRHPQQELSDDSNEARSGDGCDLNVWEDTEWVTQLLDALPPAQREVMALAYDNFTAAEIAEQLGRNEETIRSNLRHARHRLKQLVLPQTRPPKEPVLSREEEEAR